MSVYLHGEKPDCRHLINFVKKEKEKKKHKIIQ